MTTVNVEVGTGHPGTATSENVHGGSQIPRTPQGDREGHRASKSPLPRVSPPAEPRSQQSVYSH
ncbi:uncharacterized protein N7482_000947 [Penicillium canariense]|uniref:Uncharacterized protein n=1 Tax=Penicillium canariense TaxID=189055 RepID=A0A9W9LT42_9EURO|nr:uncharacterized protein N7482_000947 [Penicillium canariense]KAJ5175070.1 hypothetical protein N7482_000947 [Penicillium canariense]